jgi:zinc transport system substrate-binding protein
MDLAPFKGRAFYVFHPSFGYFSDAYSLKQVAVEQDGKAPTPRELARLIRNAKTEGTQVVLVQKSFPPKSAEAVANAIHGRVVILNPLAENPLETIQKLANVLTDSWKETTP